MARKRAPQAKRAYNGPWADDADRPPQEARPVPRARGRVPSLFPELEPLPRPAPAVDKMLGPRARHRDRKNVRTRIVHGDCRDVMARMKADSIHAIVCDPPYGLEFMGKGWDKFRLDDPGTTRNRGARAGAQGSTKRDADRLSPVAYGGGVRPTTSRCVGCGKRDQFRNPHTCPEGTEWKTEVIDPFVAPPTMRAFHHWTWLWAREALRVLKPGGYLLAFGGTRTSHRLACALEDAGFEIRDCFMFLHGMGFPKSVDLAKSIDRMRGATRPRLAPQYRKRQCQSLAGGFGKGGAWAPEAPEPVTEEAAAWHGWGSALKPAYEPVLLVQKDLRRTAEWCSLVSWLDAAVLSVVATYAKTGTLSSARHRERGCWNIATLWSATLAAVCSPRSTSTTRTAAAAITALQTLRSSLAPIIRGCTTQVVCSQPGHECGAPNADKSSSAGNANRGSTPRRTARGRATAPPGNDPSDTTAPSADGCSTARMCMANVGPSSVLSRALVHPGGVAVDGAWRSSVESVIGALQSALLALEAADIVVAPAWRLPTDERTFVPGAEPIILARKPLGESTLTKNVLTHGTGALNIQGCRIGSDPMVRTESDGTFKSANRAMAAPNTGRRTTGVAMGRWPANVLLAHASSCRPLGTKKKKGSRSVATSADWNGRSFGRGGLGGPRPARGYADAEGFETVEAWACAPDCPVALLDAQSGVSGSGTRVQSISVGRKSETGLWAAAQHGMHQAGRENIGIRDFGDAGGASRYFFIDDSATRFKYIAKPTTAERGDGNNHPTLKSIVLMAWLVRLVTPPGGVVLDPFLGSGTTMLACLYEGINCIGIELEAESVATATARLARARGEA